MYTSTRQNLSALLKYTFLLAIIKEIGVLYVTSSYLATCLIRSQTRTRALCSQKDAFRMYENQQSRKES